MLDKIIKELTATNSDDEITSEGILAWAKRIEAQRAQATLLAPSLTPNSLIRSE